MREIEFRQQLLEGKKYARMNLNGDRTTFSFGEEIGIFKGIVPSGFLRFALPSNKESLINPHFSTFEPICECGMVIDSSQPHLVRMGSCERCADAGD